MTPPVEGLFGGNKGRIERRDGLAREIGLFRRLAIEPLNQRLWPSILFLLAKMII